MNQVLDFSNCKTKKDVQKVLYNQEELEIPKGIPRKLRNFYIKVRQFIVDYQTDIFSVMHRDLPWSDYTLRWSHIGGCKMFHKDRSFHICFDGGLGHDLFSYYADYPAEDGEALSRMAKECGLFYEPRNNWSANVWED